MASLAPLMSSARGDWQTPDEILAPLKKWWRCIGLDPCTVASNPTGAAKFYTPDDDGLSMPWDIGPVFVNPPYGRGIGEWIDKCAEYAAGSAGRWVVALVPARTDTKWFPWETAEAVCFIRGRLKFRGAAHSAPFPSALIFWGNAGSPAPARGFEAAFGHMGKVVQL